MTGADFKATIPDLPQWNLTWSYRARTDAIRNVVSAVENLSLGKGPRKKVAT
jgi:hypothetical protein